MAEISIVRALRYNWWVIVVFVAVAVAAAAWFTSQQERIYRASASVVVVPTSEIEDTSDLIRSLETLERRTIVATFARMPSAPQTRSEVAERLEVEIEELRGFNIRGSVMPNTNLIQIEVTGPDRDRAIEIAAATQRSIHREARRLYRIYTARPFAEAVASSRPIFPDPERNLFVTAVVGLFLGLLAAVALQSWRGLRRPLHAS